MNTFDTPASEETGETGGPDLTALLGSRICHDLASPMGAVRNGIELMQMSGGGGAEELALISGSVEAALARLEFFRFAFGSGNPDAPIGADEVGRTVTAMYADSRSTVDWQDREDRARWDLRLAFLALLCLERAVPLGATVAVRRDGGRWAIDAEARRVVDGDLWAALRRREVPGDLQGGDVQFGLLARDARARGREIEAALDETSVRIRV